MAALASTLVLALVVPTAQAWADPDAAGAREPARRAAIPSGAPQVDGRPCPDGTTLASGAPDRRLLAPAASRSVRARWCEHYDRFGRSARRGPYVERYPSGAIRVRATYVDTQLEGPVTIRHESGRPFARGTLVAGEWEGELVIFHANGRPWLVAGHRAGRLHGPVRSYFPDGSLQSETRYQRGREDGLARSFHPPARGGRLRSEVHVEADALRGPHRLFDAGGRPRRLGHPTEPATRSRPAAPRPRSD